MIRIGNGLGAWRLGPIGSALEVTLVILAILDGAGPAGGQDVDSWRGKEVVLESRDTELMVGPEVVATGKYHRVFRVQRVKGDWLWLVSGSVSGWVRQDEIISFDQAMAECTRAIEAGIDPGWAYSKSCEPLVRQARMGARPRRLQRGIRHDPKNSVLWRNRGLAWSRLKNEDQAIADYTAAIQIEPKHGDAYESRGRSWTNLGDYDRAIADYSEAFRLNPNDALALQGRGLALLYKKEYDWVIADMTEAIRLNPRLARAYSGRGVALASKREYERALADFDEAIQHDPNDVEAYDGEATIWATCPDAQSSQWEKSGRIRDDRLQVARVDVHQLPRHAGRRSRRGREI